MRSNIFLAFFLVVMFALVVVRYAHLPGVQKLSFSPISTEIGGQEPTAVLVGSVPRPAQGISDKPPQGGDLKSAQAELGRHDAGDRVSRVKPAGYVVMDVPLNSHSTPIVTINDDKNIGPAH